MRLELVGGGGAAEIPVDGAFLEVGLAPNSGPVAALVPLNALGEIIVNRDQSDRGGRGLPEAGEPKS